MGTSVRSGTAVALIVETGSNTEYGQIAARLNQRPPENELERGLRRFGSLLLRIMLAVVVIVMAVNMLLNRAPIDTILFAVPLAVAISPEMFRTGWFTESLLTELCIIFVIRTYKPFYASRPGRFLFYATVAVIAAAILLPYSPLSSIFGFVALPISTIVAMLIITIFYIATSELTKGFFFKRFHI